MPLGQLLVQKGILTSEALDRAVAEEAASGERLDRVVLRLGLVSRQDLLHAMGEQFHLAVVDLGATEVDAAVLALLPAKVAYKQRCVPIARENGVLTVATSDPYELAPLDELRLITGCIIEPALADGEELDKFIRAHYGVGGDTLDALSGSAADVAAVLPQDEIEQAQEASVIKLVNDLLGEAISERATDVHVEPYEHELLVRYRIDGVLQRANVPASIHRFGAAIVSRLKIMANLNIAEKRRPQDGRITFKHRTPRGVEEFDLRVSIIPMLFGEGVVLRVLSKTAALMSLNDLGMPAHLLKRWDELIGRPHGILLVTGPTGSGKSTTLYASLNRIISDEIKAITVEDPVEYHVPGVNQIQVNPKVGLDFAAGLRSILRHDPDVVMIGEIRDKETADTAVQASLTGHLVFSTLHTNDAAGATTRLLDMGVEPFLVASSVEGIMAQRLVRRVCPECAEPYAPQPDDLPEGYQLLPDERHVRGKGCRACRTTGYRGRLGVFELFRLNDRTREMIMHHANARQIAHAAIEDGELSLLKHDGLAKVRAGVTTLAEVLRALTA
ncbi:MAG: type II/IV secretion system protein [Phycisphaerae bacterium]|nr:type II/IV secretion system protein [Phycisphaerae bacterium]